MPELIHLNGGPHAGRSLQGEFAPLIGLPIDAAYQAAEAPAPRAVALYQRQEENNPETFSFIGFQPTTQAPLEIEFVAGPYAGKRLLPEIRLKASVPLASNGNAYVGVGDPAAVALYRLVQTEGSWCYQYDRIDDSLEVVEQASANAHEHKLQGMIQQFYRQPNYDIYSMKPTGNHVQVLVEVGWRRGYVDEGIAGLITALWRLGLDTIGSCQQRPTGDKYEGQAYVGFFRLSDAEMLHSWLSASEIPSTLKETQGSMVRQDDAGKPAGEPIKYTNANVLFEPSLIERVTQALHDKQPIRP